MLPLLGQESCMRVKVQKVLHTTLHSFLAWSPPNGRSSKKCYRITVCVCVLLSFVRLFTIPWTVACQAPLSMRFSKQEEWSGLPELLLLFYFPHHDQKGHNWHKISAH